MLSSNTLQVFISTFLNGEFMTLTCEQHIYFVWTNLNIKRPVSPYIIYKIYMASKMSLKTISFTYPKKKLPLKTKILFLIAFYKAIHDSGCQ